MTDPLILRADTAGVARLVLNAPGSLNALSTPMLLALDAMLSEIAQDRAVRVVIISGSGRAFSAGHDLKEMQAARAMEDGGTTAFADLFALCTRVMTRITGLPQPVIAQVHGLAAAAGCQLAASCDLVTAAEDARFGVNGVTIGLFCSTPMVALTRKVPPAVAFEMLTTGEFLSAQRAREVGLVNRVAPASDLNACTDALARSIAEKLQAAVKIGKSGFYSQLGLPLDQAYAQTGAAMVENLQWRDTAEGIQAFLEKRKPDWA